MSRKKNGGNELIPQELIETPENISNEEDTEVLEDSLKGDLEEVSTVTEEIEAVVETAPEVEEITKDTEVEDELNEEQEIIETEPSVLISDAVVKYVEENPTVGIKSAKSYRVKSFSKGIRLIP